MNEKIRSSVTQPELSRTISVKRSLFDGLRDKEYRRLFIAERVRASVALQIQALRAQNGKMTQTQLGALLGKAQPWISKLEDPEYGKVTVATLLEVSDAFDVDLEIKFRPFSHALDELAAQGADYYQMPSFEAEKGAIEASIERIEDRMAGLPSDSIAYYRPVLPAGPTAETIPLEIVRCPQGPYAPSIKDTTTTPPKDSHGQKAA
jgi:transcriptional regulator with XRE-family HTH domain